MSFFRKVSDSESSDSDSEEELMSDYEKEEGAEKETKSAAAPAKKSAFLKSADSDSDDDDDSDEDESDEGDSDEEDEDDDGEGGPAVRKQSRFLRGASDDSDSEEEEVKKVIKSAREKRVDEMDAVAKTIENAQRIDDWVAISKEFDTLNRLSDRIKVVNEPTPPIYYKTLVALDDFLNESITREKNAEKKMKAPNVRAMNGMKQKMKKVIKDHESAIATYRQDPEAFEANYTSVTAPTPLPAQPKKSKKSTLAAAGDEEEEDEDFQTVGRGGKAVTYTSEGLFKSLAAVMEARGKKSTDRTEQIEILTKLMAVAASTYQKIRVLLALLAARFDYNQSAAAYMKIEMWNSALKEVEQLIKIVDSDRGYQIKEITPDYDDEIDRLPNQNGEGSIIEVRGSLISFVERLDDEFTKSLQFIDPHTTEYVDRLRDEKLLYRTIILGQNYFETVNQPSSLSRIMMRRLDHIYAKPDNIIQALETASASAGEPLKASKSGLCPSPEEVAASPEGASHLIRSLCVQLYKTTGFETERLRTRAMLYHIYHHALRRDYHVARDMFLMSHLQDSIGMADAATQILYNRVVVQLGVCAFRVGLIRESQGALQEIFASTRVKELLAQGVSRTNPYATPEQEKLDRQRQLPFHMHINLELLECIYLVGSMLLEIPNIASASSEADQRRNVISRTFRKMLDFTDRQVFSGPAESTRDHVMAAAKALQSGNWKESQEQIAEIKIWKLMNDHEEIIKMLKGKIQEEGLRTYLFTYSHFYKSLSLRHLAEMFELSNSKVKSIISVMIWNEELQASLDIGEGKGENEDEGGYVVLHGVQLSKVQILAQQLAEKANSLLEQNERSLDAKLGDRTSTGEGRTGGQDRDGRDGRDGHTGSRREGRRGGGSAGRGRGRGRGRAQFNALPGQQTV